MCEGFGELSVLITQESERGRAREGGRETGVTELPLLFRIIGLSFNYPSLLHWERCWYRTAQIAEIPAPSPTRGRLRMDLFPASPTPALCPNMAANDSGHHATLEPSPLPLVRFQSGRDKRKCRNK